MNMHLPQSSGFVVCSTVVAGLLGPIMDSADAAIIQITDGQAPSTTSVVADARFRVDSNNWDVVLTPDGNPTPSSPQYNLGGLSQINGTLYNFTLDYKASTGLLRWTVNTPSAALVQTLQLLPNSLFFYIDLLTAAKPRTTDPVGTTYTLDINNVSFLASGGHTVVGSITNTDLDIVGTPTSPASDSKSISSSTNLGSIDWSLSGDLTALVANSTSNPSERLKFDVYLRIPEPATGALVTAPLAMLALRRRSRMNLC